MFSLSIYHLDFRSSVHPVYYDNPISEQQRVSSQKHHCQSICDLRRVYQLREPCCVFCELGPWLIVNTIHNYDLLSKLRIKQTHDKRNKLLKFEISFHDPGGSDFQLGHGRGYILGYVLVKMNLKTVICAPVYNCMSINDEQINYQRINFFTN